MNRVMIITEAYLVYLANRLCRKIRNPASGSWRIVQVLSIKPTP